MIGQCLSNKNESATVLKSKKFLDLNKALIEKFSNRLSPELRFIHAKFLGIRDLSSPFQLRRGWR